MYYVAKTAKISPVFLKFHYQNHLQVQQWFNLSVYVRSGTILETPALRKRKKKIKFQFFKTM